MTALVWSDATQYSRGLHFCNRPCHCTSLGTKPIGNILRSNIRILSNRREDFLWRFLWRSACTRLAKWLCKGTLAETRLSKQKPHIP